MTLCTTQKAASARRRLQPLPDLFPGSVLLYTGAFFCSRPAQLDGLACVDVAVREDTLPEDTVVGMLTRERVRELLATIRRTHPDEAILLQDHLHALAGENVYQTLLIEIVSVQKDGIAAENQTAAMIEQIRDTYTEAVTAIAELARVQAADQALAEQATAKNDERVDKRSERAWGIAVQVARSPYFTLFVGGLLVWFLERLGVSVSQLGALFSGNEP